MRLLAGLTIKALLMLQCKCNNIIPQGRVDLGYKVCVNCSTTEAYGCAPLINHKTGNSIQIMSSSDAARIAKLTQRRGYGTMLGKYKCTSKSLLDTLRTALILLDTK